MIVRPAIDIREGQCVQLIGGSYEDELIRIPDVLQVRNEWIAKGFTKLHLIDLDRATNRGNNFDVIQNLCTANVENNLEIDYRVGGGLRSEKDIEDLLSCGVSSVVLGTKALKEPDWFNDIVEKFPDRILLAIEVFEENVKVSGWSETFNSSLYELLNRYNNSKLAGIFITAIHKEGRRQGTDIQLFAKAREVISVPLIASGGVTTTSDIDQLTELGIDEVVLGAAIYTDPNLVVALQERITAGRINES